MTLHAEFRAYLAELESSLADREQADRAEIVDGVREHIESAVTALGHKPSAAERRQILDALGPVESVAAGSAPAGERRSMLARSWLPAVALVLQLGGMVFAIFGLPLVALLIALTLIAVSPLYRAWEKVLSVVSTCLGVVGSILVIGVALQGQAGCEDPTVGASAGDCPTDATFYTQSVVGWALLLITCAVAAVIGVIAIRRSMGIGWTGPGTMIPGKTERRG